jgi:hypothetical protein
MTAAVSRRTAPSRDRGLKGLAGVLGFVCLVLFLLAIEQRHAVAAWEALRDRAGPAVGRAFDRLPIARADGADGQRRPASPGVEPLAPAAADLPLAGEFRPVDEATRTTAGGAAFLAARIRFESGETLHTRPLRIAAAGEAFAPGRTFAGQWNAPTDAQIELRTITPPPGAAAVPASPLCAGARPAAVALLHRRDRLDLMLFAAGADGPPGQPCGVWSFERR